MLDLLTERPVLVLSGTLVGAIAIAWLSGRALVIATIGAVSWLAACVAFLIEDSVLRRVKIDVRDNRRARRVRTQMGIIRRLTAVIVTIVGLAAALMTFDTMRTYGASVLASAGLVGVVAGLAAQTMLGNVFAGLQLVFTDALRYDDVGQGELASAADASSAWDLKCDLREQLLAWIHAEHPQALPGIRTKPSENLGVSSLGLLEASLRGQRP